MFTPPFILLDDQLTPRRRFYANPLDIVTITDPKNIEDGFSRLQTCIDQGHHLAGFISYELGYLLEPKLVDRLPKHRSVPLMQFGVFDGFSNPQSEEVFQATDNIDIHLTPAWSREQYTQKFDQVLKYLQAGDIYQANLTFPLEGHFSGSAKDLYLALRRRQPAHYGGIISLGDIDIISLSPELFFKKSESNISMQPMKGTRPRQSDPTTDDIIRNEMQTDEKSLAENLMIVDLLRNDLSRIAKAGSVKVPDLFTLETYPTLHQMTSKVSAKLQDKIEFKTLFKSLFPCGSVTGAPKIRAMEIIHELENTPRGAYCGAIGYIDPNQDACFNVAIRTATLNKGHLTYNVGSGLVIDGRASEEYSECLLKAKILKPRPNLIETLKWEPALGFIRLERHLSRLTRSAEALGYAFDKRNAEKKLQAAIRQKSSDQRIKLSLSPQGKIDIEAAPYTPMPGEMRVVISKNPLTPLVQNTAHKISDREFYDGERKRVQALIECDEVLFVNNQNELCEGSFTSLFLKQQDTLTTPPLSCGLLPGILREALLEDSASEAIMYPNDLMGQTFFIGNSLRGLMSAKLVSPTPM